MADIYSGKTKTFRIEIRDWDIRSGRKCHGRRIAYVRDRIPGGPRHVPPPEPASQEALTVSPSRNADILANGDFPARVESPKLINPRKDARPAVYGRRAIGISTDV